MWVLNPEEIVQLLQKKLSIVTKKKNFENLFSYNFENTQTYHVGINSRRNSLTFTQNLKFPP